MLVAYVLMDLVGFYGGLGLVGVNGSSGQFQSSALADITITVPYKKTELTVDSSIFTRDTVRLPC
jgi:hypothetical protein